MMANHGGRQHFQLQRGDSDEYEMGGVRVDRQHSIGDGATTRARARMEAGSRNESRCSTSSVVIQNDLSAFLLDMVLKIFLSMKP